MMPLNSKLYSPNPKRGQALRLRSGQATLGFVFVVASIIVAVSISFVFIVISLINSGYAYQSAQQASLAAHSGVEDALLLLARNKDFISAGYPLTVGPATVTVSIIPNTPVAGEISIISNAKIGTNSRQSQAVVTITPSTGILNILAWSETVQTGQAALAGTTIATVPLGVAVTVDGSTCTAPCFFPWNVGSGHTIAASSTAPGSLGTQYIYGSWSDGGAISHTVTVLATSTTYTANFTAQYFLTTTSSPAAGGTISPISQWYNTGSSPSVSANSSGTNLFAGFSGALSGTSSPQNILMNAPQSVTANFTLSSHNPPWYASGNWGYRQAVTLTRTMVASSTGTEGYINFPVLVNVTSTGLRASSSGGHVGNFDGSDILFTRSDGTTKVNHEIELYTSSTGNLVAWVQMPAVSTSTDTIFYMYYGNAGVANQQNASGTWDASYKGVWHLANPTNPIDSTSNANNGTNNSTAATAGQIGGGANMASSNFISIPDSAGFHFGTGVFSFGMWVKIPVFGQYNSLAGNNIYSGGWSGISMCMDVLHSINGITPVVVGYSYPATVPITDVNITANVWHYIVTTRDSSGTVSVYWDGAKSIYSFTNAGNVNSGNSLYLGRNFDTTYPRGFGGSEDEVRLSNTNRSADWIKTEYNNQSAPASFETFGSEEAQ
jgi:Domain of unknown function (DUF2341)